MTVLSDERFTQSRNLGPKRVYPLAVDIGYAGGMIMINAAGFAQPATAEAANGGVVGVATETVDNSGGSAGDVTIEVQEGDFRLTAVSIVQGDLGATMFALDDQTVDETQLANQPQAGKLIEFISATEGWVRIGVATAS